jgi:hypothetical protein
MFGDNVIIWEINVIVIIYVNLYVICREAFGRDGSLIASLPVKRQQHYAVTSPIYAA